uniref:Uncharacterized protein n=1 Tax=viral metagenome TaxID=1070528 RepID=A0A6C0KNM0_9ZZZZ
MRTKKLKRRRQNGGIRGITFKDAKRLLTKMSPGTALRDMAKSLRSKKVSAVSPESSASSASPASSGTDSQGSLEEAIAILMQDYDKALPETLDEIIVLMQKYEADLTTVIRSLTRAIKKMKEIIKINTEIIKDVAKKIKKLESKPEDEVYENTIPYSEDTIIQTAVNLQTSNNNLKVLNEALTKFETARTDARKKKRPLLKQQKEQNGDNNSEIIANFKHEWIDIQKTLHEAHEVIKQQKEKIAINASRQASTSQTSPRQASPRQTSPSQAIPSQAIPSQASTSRASRSQASTSQASRSQTIPSQASTSQAIPRQTSRSRVASKVRATPRTITSRSRSQVAPNSGGGAQIRRSRTHRKPKRARK